MASTAVHQSICTDFHKGPPAQGRAVIEPSTGVKNSDRAAPGILGAVTVDTVPVRHVSSGHNAQNHSATDAGNTMQSVDANVVYGASAEAPASDSHRVKRKRGKVLTSIAALALGLASLGIRIAELVGDSV